MVDYILASLMVGMALTYILELVDLGFVSRASLNKFLTLPLSIGGFYLLGYWDTSLVVAVPSSIFVALYIGKQLNKPAQVITPRLPRI
jgi:hypothetical protein